ncbi:MULTISPECIES: HK97 family phage prohead protease [Rhodopseudomonas]|uniref:HK97 family phage prohead protease n=1 Tax=Rhodopseudomonas TaxID=1073 RepID=UPI0006970465|nr:MULTISPECIES: HK97 family phage prohead protease [Rhodopseudomonas]MDF3811279.1 HK97 family phage prohead protease [Rhodopseudomonas sp. BAL398]WOK18604.1 HK97 family phage prohead protease [Rhodopseudomonas sp. BAL398]
MNEFATLLGEIEVRASRRRGGGRKLRGRFPYRKRAVLSDGGRKGGRPQKEEFAPGAFSYSINDAAMDQNLLVGHSFDMPLASKKTGTLIFDDTAEALIFDAEITPQIADTSYGADILKQIDSGLSVGLSPGFRLPPPRAVAKPEVFTDEGHDPARGMHNAVIRTIFAAILFELSVVTRPAYKEASVVIDPEDMTDEEKIAAGWTMNAAGILVPPPLTITRAMPAALRWR